MIRIAGVLGLALLLCALAAAPSQAKVFGISTSGGFVVRLGPLDVKRHPYLADAVKAFGATSEVKRIRGACVARWSRFGLKATFTSFGAISDFCGAGFFQTAVIRSSRWRTWAGLRVGMRSSRVPALHHNAKFTDGKWVLASQTVYGLEPGATVSALVSGGRVRAFSLWVGGAGD